MVIKDVSTLKIWDKNPKNISKKGFDRLIEEMKLGQHSTLLVMPDGTVLGGNQRLRAMKELGIDKAKCIVVDFIKESDEGYIAILDGEPQRSNFFPTKEAGMMAYSISHNDNAGYYDADLLANLGEEYKIDLDKYAVNFYELETIKEQLDRLAKEKETEEDQIPKIKDGPAKSKLGEVYKLGNHKLMCGDALNEKDIKKLMGENKAQIIFTSPPYNMDSKMYVNYKDDLKSEEYIDFNIKTVKQWKPYLAGFLFWNISYNKNSRWEFIHILYKLTKETGLTFLELVVWDKGHGTPITTKDSLTRQYEDIYILGDQDSIQKDLELYYVGSIDRRAWFNKKTNKGITNYWRVNSNDSQIQENLACFPIELPKRGIWLMSKEKDIVVDPFAGSGTTLIACEQTDRICYSMELDPKLCDVIRKRYAKFINKEDQWETITPKV